MPSFCLLLSVWQAWVQAGIPCDIITGYFLRLKKATEPQKAELNTTVFTEGVAFVMTSELAFCVKVCEILALKMWEKDTEVLPDEHGGMWKTGLKLSCSTIYRPTTHKMIFSNHSLLPCPLSNKHMETHLPVFQLRIPAEHGWPAGGSRAEELPGWGGRALELHRQRSDPHQEGCHVSPGQEKKGGDFTLSGILQKILYSRLMFEEKEAQKNQND